MIRIDIFSIIKRWAHQPHPKSTEGASHISHISFLDTWQATVYDHRSEMYQEFIICSIIMYNFRLIYGRRAHLKQVCKFIWLVPSLLKAFWPDHVTFTWISLNRSCTSRPIWLLSLNTLESTIDWHFELKSTLPFLTQPLLTPTHYHPNPSLPPQPLITTQTLIITTHYHPNFSLPPLITIPHPHYHLKPSLPPLESVHALYPIKTIMYILSQEMKNIFHITHSCPFLTTPSPPPCKHF